MGAEQDKVKYEVRVSFPVAGVSRTVKEIEDSVNNTMSNFGYKDEKIVIRSSIDLILTVNRTLTQTEKDGMSHIIEENYTKGFGPSHVLSFKKIR